MQRRSLIGALGAFTMRPASALYDPKPIPFLEAATGTWAGTLTYRDYQKPDRTVSLKTVMTATLVAPDELALYYVFDDGPGKTVYSYERMTFDLAAHRVLWSSGISKPSRMEYVITAHSAKEGRHALAFETTQDAETQTYALEFSAKDWLLTKHESSEGQEKVLRSKYELMKRAG